MLSFEDTHTNQQNGQAGGPASRHREGAARDWFVFGMLAEIRPRTKEEAVAVLRYLGEEERMDMQETNAILMNLVGGA